MTVTGLSSDDVGWSVVEEGQHPFSGGKIVSIPTLDLIRVKVVPRRVFDGAVTKCCNINVYLSCHILLSSSPEQFVRYITK